MTKATLELIACPRMPGGLRLSPASCARSYQDSQKAEPWDTARHCQGCGIGARNSGEKVIVVPPRQHFCVRCGDPTRRLIGRLLCVSCFNRQREYVIGVNARGTPAFDYQAPDIWDTDLGIQVGRDAAEVATVCQRLLDLRPAWVEGYGAARSTEIRDWWQAMVIPHSAQRRQNKFGLAATQTCAAPGRQSARCGC